MTDAEKYPNNRNLEKVEDGFDDNLDVPTYRKLADGADYEAPTQQIPAQGESVSSPVSKPVRKSNDGLAPGPVAEPNRESAALNHEPAQEEATTERNQQPAETEVIRKPAYDAYAAAGRSKPQVIQPTSATEHAAERTTDDRTDVQSSSRLGATATDSAAGGATAASATPNFSHSVDSEESIGRSTGADYSDAKSRADLDSRRTTADEDAPTQMYSTDQHNSASAVGSDRYDDSDFSSDDHRTELIGAGAAAGGATAVGAGASSDRAFSEDPDNVGDTDEHVAYREAETRRGTTDFGLFLLRLAVGGLLILHGLTTLFGWGNSGGVSVLTATFNDNGFALANVLGIAIPTTQLIAGGLLVLGLATPLGAALALGLSAYLTMFEVATSSTGWNVIGSTIANSTSSSVASVQLQLILTAAALALQFTGPGRIGIDFGRGWARRPLASSWIFCIFGIAAAVVLWYFTAGNWPFVGAA